jgi:hypothetical protein
MHEGQDQDDDQDDQDGGDIALVHGKHVIGRGLFAGAKFGITRARLPRNAPRRRHFCARSGACQQRD